VSFAIVALSVVLRLAWISLVPTRPVGDFALYVESAAHLLAHGGLDAEFIYMPGYVFLLAGVQALGGGLWAMKLIGVAAGGVGTWAVFVTAERLFSRGAAVAAALLHACWPAGIAVASVTGTDMPAAALLGLAVALLVRGGGDGGRPLRASALFGLVLGLAAYVRAVALPLALLALPYWLAARAPWRAALARTALSCAVAFLLLLPWGLRNQRRYGELFFTDSHGGHTALVGANPNSEGTYSRSLNLMFTKGTGYRLFDPSPRDSDRAAYALAKAWARREPAYAAGLVAAKADRLLTHERGLLYWPVYRASVLRDPQRAWFERRRAGLEALADWFWYALAAAAAAGVAVAAARRDWRALAVTLFPAALVALYATFFSEVRYHLAIAIFMFPFAGAALAWLARAARGGVDRRRLGAEALAAAAAIALVAVAWPRLVAAGAALRDRHRWGVAVCTVGGQTRLCEWLPVRGGASARVGGRSPVRGVWDGVGLRVTAVTPAAAESAIDLPAGRYRIDARADAGAGTVSPRVQLFADGQAIGAPVEPPRIGAPPARLAGTVDHAGGPLRLEFRAGMDAGAAPSVSAPATEDVTATAWLYDINVEPDPR
jgi:4-amino-4-deoxy-L-arabinose transferase-like glycosyltransferase